MNRSESIAADLARLKKQNKKLRKSNRELRKTVQRNKSANTSNVERVDGRKSNSSAPVRSLVEVPRSPDAAHEPVREVNKDALLDALAERVIRKLAA